MHLVPRYEVRVGARMSERTGHWLRATRSLQAIATVPIAAPTRQTRPPCTTPLQAPRPSCRLPREPRDFPDQSARYRPAPIARSVQRGGPREGTAAHAPEEM